MYSFSLLFAVHCAKKKTTEACVIKYASNTAASHHHNLFSIVLPQFQNTRSRHLFLCESEEAQKIITTESNSLLFKTPLTST